MATNVTELINVKNNLNTTPVVKGSLPYKYTDELSTKIVLDKVKYERVLFDNSIGIGLNGTLASHDYSNVNNLPIVGQFVNAIDINWNNPFITPLSGQSLYMGINTTSDLLNYIKESFTWGQSNPNNLVLQSTALEEINDYKIQISEYKNKIHKILNRRISFISYAYMNDTGATKPYEIEDLGRNCSINIPVENISYSNGEHIFAWFKCEKNIENYESYLKFNITGNIGETNINSQIDWVAVGDSVKSIQISNGINLYMNIKSFGVHQYVPSSIATMYSYSISAKEANGINSLGDKNVNLVITPLDSDGTPADKSLKFNLYVDVPTTFKGFIVPNDFRLNANATDNDIIPHDDAAHWYNSIYNIDNNGYITGFSDICKNGIIKIMPSSKTYGSDLYLTFEYRAIIQFYDNNSSSWKDIAIWTQSSGILYNTDITDNNANIFNEFKQYLYDKALSDYSWNLVGARRARDESWFDSNMRGISFSTDTTYIPTAIRSNEYKIGTFYNLHELSKNTATHNIDVYIDNDRSRIPNNVFTSFGLKPYGTTRRLTLRQPYNYIANTDFSSDNYYKKQITDICTERSGGQIIYTTANMFNSPSNNPNIDYARLTIEQQEDKKLSPGFRYIATDLNEASEIVGNYGIGTCFGHAPFIIYKINGSLYTFVKNKTNNSNKLFVKINSRNVNNYANNFSLSLTTDIKTSGAKVFVNYFDSSENRYTVISDPIQIVNNKLDIEVQVWFYYDQSIAWWSGSRTEEFTQGNYDWWNSYSYKPDIELHEGINTLTNLPGLKDFSIMDYYNLEKSILNDSSKNIEYIFEGTDVTDKYKNDDYNKPSFDNVGLNKWGYGGHGDFPHYLESTYYGNRSEFTGQNIIYLNNISQ